MGPKYLGFVFPLVVTMTGCALVSGLSNLDVATDAAVDPSADGAVDSSTDGGSSDASPDSPVVVIPDGGCGCDLTVPLGFSPILYGSDGDNCPNSATVENVVTNPVSGIASGTCSCSCSLGGCSTAKLQIYALANCSNIVGTLGVSGTCQGSPQNYASAVAMKLTGNGSGNVSCSTTPSFAKPYGNQAALCTPSSSTTCASLCQPPQGTKTCFVANGDVSCPQTAPQRTLIAKSVTDARTCTGCTCSVTNGVCNANVQSYSDSNCATVSGNAINMPAETCTPVTVGPNTIVKVTASGTCSTTVGAAGGATTPVSMRTVCCK